MILHYLEIRGDVAGPWIGLSGKPRKMAWTDGRDVDYENWAPDRKEGRCVRVKLNYQYAWALDDCSRNAKYICRTGELTIDVIILIFIGSINFIGRYWC